MPPSGFSQKAINGLLEFIKASYQATLLEYDPIKEESEIEFLNMSVGLLEQKVNRTIREHMPLQLSEEGVRGMVTFVSTCYKDLVEEIYAGEDRYNRKVIDGKAMKKEISQIGDYLKDFTI